MLVPHWYKEFLRSHNTYLSQNPIYYSWFWKGGEGENVSVVKALRGQKHLRSSGKGPQKWETGGAEPPGPEYRLTPLLDASTQD